MEMLTGISRYLSLQYLEEVNSYWGSEDAYFITIILYRLIYLYGVCC